MELILGCYVVMILLMTPFQKYRPQKRASNNKIRGRSHFLFLQMQMTTYNKQLETGLLIGGRGI